MPGSLWPLRNSVLNVKIGLERIVTPISSVFRSHYDGRGRAEITKETGPGSLPVSDSSSISPLPRAGPTDTRRDTTPSQVLSLRYLPGLGATVTRTATVITQSHPPVTVPAASGQPA